MNREYIEWLKGERYIYRVDSISYIIGDDNCHAEMKTAQFEKKHAYEIGRNRQIEKEIEFLSKQDNELLTMYFKNITNERELIKIEYLADTEPKSTLDIFGPNSDIIEIQESEYLELISKYKETTNGCVITTTAEI